MTGLHLEPYLFLESENHSLSDEEVQYSKEEPHYPSFTSGLI